MHSAIYFAYRSPSADDHIYDCLVNTVSRIQQADERAGFLVMGDFNCHHSDWLGSRLTNDHGCAAYEFVSELNLSQLVPSLTHKDGGVLD